MKPGVRTSIINDWHVMPINDLMAHQSTRTCWCSPRLDGDRINAPVLVIHNSADGRELVEEHGVN